MVKYVSNVKAVQDPAAIERVVVVATAKAYDASFASVVYEQLMPLLVESPGGLPFFNAMWATLQDSQSTQHWIPRGDAALLKFAMARLPARVSRHNAPGQPHNVASLLKGLGCGKGSAPTLVVLLCEDQAHIPSLAHAVARVATKFDGEEDKPKPDGFYYYSRKSSSSKGKETDSSAADANADANVADDAPKTPSLQVAFSSDIADEQLREFTTVCRNILLTRRLVDMPCNELYTTAFVKEAMAAVDGLPNVTVEIIEGEALKEGGYGGLYGVGKAAANPPALVTLKHYPTPESKTLPSIVLVGKGIVYDTGGLSIKTKTGMPGMKRDMGGAAAILGAFCSIAQEQGNQRPVHAILCLAENAVSPIATRPDDVHTLLSGRTVEINNTDAEGRLVLADGVAAAVQHLNPGTIMDMATLTGAQGVATGRFFGAIYCNDEDLETKAITVGRSCGDLVHAVPYAPEFFIPEFKSAVADMKNSVGDRANAQVSCAGQFIANHMQSYLEEEGKQWIHIDMAYPVHDKKDERATGYGVALLHSLVKQLQQE